MKGELTMAQRCCLYKRGETYFVICTSGNDCPPMPGAENVTWWMVEDCRDCKVPPGYPVPAPEKPTSPCGGGGAHPPVPTSPGRDPAAPPVGTVTDLGSGGWECDDDLKQIFAASENLRVSIFLEPCPGSSIEVIAAKKVRTDPPDIVQVNRPETVTVTGNTIGIECKRGHEVGRCKYRIVQIAAL
jgi:hypothetical protein